MTDAAGRYLSVLGTVVIGLPLGAEVVAGRISVVHGRMGRPQAAPEHLIAGSRRRAGRLLTRHIHTA